MLTVPVFIVYLSFKTHPIQTLYAFNFSECEGSPVNEEQELEKEMKELEEKLTDRELALPAHSIRPAQLLIIEELEEEIKEKKRRLAALEGIRVTPDAAS
jgi:hypothetical protein